MVLLSQLTKENTASLETLPSRIDSFTNISGGLKFGRCGKAVGSPPGQLCGCFDIQHQGSLKVNEVYAIFDPHLLSSSDDDSFNEYGVTEIQLITNHSFLAMRKRRPSYSVSAPRSSFSCPIRSYKYILEATSVHF